MNCEHQKKWCQNGVGPDLTKKWQINEGFKLKSDHFLEGSKNEISRPPSSREKCWNWTGIYVKKWSCVNIPVDVWKNDQKVPENVMFTV